VFDGNAEGDGWLWSDSTKNLKPDEKKRLEEAALRRKAKRSTSAVRIGGSLGTPDVVDPADSL
jgi:hypothetical protein